MSVFSVKDFQGIPKLMLTGEMKGMAKRCKRRSDAAEHTSLALDLECAWHKVS